MYLKSEDVRGVTQIGFGVIAHWQILSGRALVDWNSALLSTFDHQYERSENLSCDIICSAVR